MLPKMSIVDAPTSEMRNAIAEPLVRFNEIKAGSPEDFRLLAIPLSDPSTNAIVGGLWGNTMFSHLHVDLLFVPETMRGRGIGRKLLSEAEAEAARRGCNGAWLDTYSFQARGFYERCGYSTFGIIEDYPPGHCRIFLRKKFQQ